MPYGLDGKAIPPYVDAQVQIENRELKAQIARATRLLEAAAVRVATLRRALEPFLKRFKRLDEWTGGNKDMLAPETELHYTFRAGDIRTLVAALRDPSPLAEAAGAVLEWIAEAERQEAALPAGLWELFNEYRALRDSMPLGYGTPETGEDGGMG